LLRRGAQSVNNIDWRRSLVTRDLWERVQGVLDGRHAKKHRLLCQARNSTMSTRRYVQWIKE